MTSTKLIERNIALQIKRNIKAGLIIGAILAGWKFKGLYQDIVESATSDYKKIQKIIRKPKHNLSIKSKTYKLVNNPKLRLLFAFLRYFKNFPLFLASFTIIFKYMIHSKIFEDKSSQNKINLSIHKYKVAGITFILSYFCQYSFHCFTWNWSLFLLIRSIFSFFKLLIPKDIQPNIIDIYPFIHGMLGLCLAFNCKYVPSKWWILVEKCVNERKDRWYYMLGNHNHSILPPCTSLVHQPKNNGHLEISCLKSFFIDNIKRSKPIFIFFTKFYLLTTLLNVKGVIKQIKRGNVKHFIFKKLLRNIFGSFGFFMIGVAIAGRIPCFYKWIIFKVLNDNIEYNQISCNNKACLIFICMILGRLSILCEVKSRRIDVALSCIWNVLQQIIRMACNLESDDNGKYHPLLRSNKFTSMLFAVNMWITMFVYCSDSSCLKGMERSIIDNYLIK